MPIFELFTRLNNYLLLIKEKNLVLEDPLGNTFKQTINGKILNVTTPKFKTVIPVSSLIPFFMGKNMIVNNTMYLNFTEQFIIKGCQNKWVFFYDRTTVFFLLAKEGLEEFKMKVIYPDSSMEYFPPQIAFSRYVSECFWGKLNTHYIILNPSD